MTVPTAMRLGSLWLAASTFGCAPGPENTPTVLEVEASVNQFNGTLVMLSWDESVCPGATPLVSLEPDDGQVLPRTGGQAEAVLLGLPPTTDHDFVLDLEVDGEICATGEGSFTTHASATSAPELAVTTDDGSTHGFLMTTKVTSPAGPALLDTSGNVVWFWADDTLATVTRAVLARDRTSVIYTAWLDNPLDPDGTIHEIVRVSLDGQHVQRTPTQGMHHDLLEREDGTIAYLGGREVETEPGGEPWTADIIVELSPNGSERVVWDAWGLFTYDDWVIPDDRDQRDLREWTHANALRYSPAEDAYYVSLRWRSCIIKVDATTGQTLWIFGGDDSTFDLLEGTWPSDQHQFRIVEDRLLVFDNGSLDALDSRVVEYVIDESAGTARQVWEYREDPAAYGYVLGDVETLDNGNVAVAWCSFGRIDVVTRSGDLVWRTNASLGSAFGYVEWLADLAPLDP